MNGFLSGLNSSSIKKLQATLMFVPQDSLLVSEEGKEGKEGEAEN